MEDVVTRRLKTIAALVVIDEEIDFLIFLHIISIIIIMLIKIVIEGRQKKWGKEKLKKREEGDEWRDAFLYEEDEKNEIMTIVMMVNVKNK